MGFFIRTSEFITFILISLIIHNDCCEIRTMKDLIQSLVYQDEINSEKVAYTMLAVDRKDFCNVTNEHEAYENRDLSIGYGSVINAPSVQVTVLEVLEQHLKKPNVKVLQLGSGSGYLTVCMGLMLGEGGNVTSIEDWPQLVELSVNNTKKQHAELLETNKIKFIQGMTREGYLKESPYDVIYMGGAMETYPEYIIVNQLKPGGRFVGPIGPKSEQYLTVIDKNENSKLLINSLTKVSFKSLEDSDEGIIKKVLY